MRAPRNPFDTGHIYYTRREVIAPRESGEAKPVAASKLAARLAADIRKSRAANPEKSTALPLRILKASEFFRQKDADQRLRKLLLDDASCFPSMLMLAANIQSKHRLCGI